MQTRGECKEEEQEKKKLDKAIRSQLDLTVDTGDTLRPGVNVNQVKSYLNTTGCERILMQGVEGLEETGSRIPCASSEIANAYLQEKMCFV